MEYPEDIPSPIDLKDPEQARRWVEDTVIRRPYRADFFRAFQQYLGQKTVGPIRVLELGSGPGHLAASLLSTQSRIEQYVLLDFSPAMQTMARDGLRSYSAVTQFVEADFGQPHALGDIGSFEVIVTMQAVHELRHQRHAVGLYRQVRDTLASSGHFLACDHVVRDPTAPNAALFMSREQQSSALETAGFDRVERLLELEGMILHAARGKR